MKEAAIITRYLSSTATLCTQRKKRSVLTILSFLSCRYNDLTVINGVGYAFII